LSVKPSIISAPIGVVLQVDVVCFDQRAHDVASIASQVSSERDGARCFKTFQESATYSQLAHKIATTPSQLPDRILTLFGFHLFTKNLHLFLSRGA
jgi:hypothetical protein